MTTNRKAKYVTVNLYIVRHYDGMDNCWTDVSKPLPKIEADQVWLDKTDGGTRATHYNDIDYYRVFPAGTGMVHSEEGNAHFGIKTVR